jgi:hypothetical protein
MSFACYNEDSLETHWDKIKIGDEVLHGGKVYSVTGKIIDNRSTIGGLLWMEGEKGDATKPVRGKGYLLLQEERIEDSMLDEIGMD